MKKVVKFGGRYGSKGRMPFKKKKNGKIGSMDFSVLPKFANFPCSRLIGNWFPEWLDGGDCDCFYFADLIEGRADSPRRSLSVSHFHPTLHRLFHCSLLCKFLLEMETSWVLG